MCSSIIHSHQAVNTLLACVTDSAFLKKMRMGGEVMTSWRDALPATERTMTFGCITQLSNVLPDSLKAKYCVYLKCLYGCKIYCCVLKCV